MEVFFKACSDRTRLRLLNLLNCEGEVCVLSLVEVIGTNQPKVSRHLAYLKKSGLVEARKNGLWVYYALTKPDSEERRSLLQCLLVCFVGVEVLQEDVRKLRTFGNSKTGEGNLALEGAPRAEYTSSDSLEIELL